MSEEPPATVDADTILNLLRTDRIDQVSGLLTERGYAEIRARDREAKRIADAVRAFAEFGDALPGVWVCLGCHALVNDREHHVRWHDSLNETARKADDADWRGRPIG